MSVHEGGNLRGCIGTTEPTKKTFAQELVHNATAAVSRDPRFHPVQEYELPDLEIKVDVLNPAEKTDLEGLDPKIYGVIVSSGHKRGLLLPDLEGVDTAEEQVSIARQKAGIGEGEPVEYERFTVTRYV